MYDICNLISVLTSSISDRSQPVRIKWTQNELNHSLAVLPPSIIEKDAEWALEPTDMLLIIKDIAYRFKLLLQIYVMYILAWFETMYSTHK